MQPKSVRDALRIAQAMGRGNDTILAHINPREAALLKKRGGSGKRNPLTGLLEFDDEEGAKVEHEATPDNANQTQKENDADNAAADKAVQAQKDEAARVMSENDADNAAADAASRVIGIQRNEPFSSMETTNPYSAVSGVGVGPSGFNTQGMISQREFQNQQTRAMGFDPNTDYATQLGKVSQPAPNADVSAATPGPAVMAGMANDVVPTPIPRPDQLNWSATVQPDPVKTAVALARNVNTPPAIEPADLPAKYIPPAAMPDTAVTNNLYAGFNSEDPAEIARYNAAVNAAGPKNTLADMSLGQRAPNVTTNNPIVNAVQGVNDVLTNLVTPSYNLGSPEYNAISQRPERVEPTHENFDYRGGRDVLYPPATGTSNDLGNIPVNKPISTLFTPGTPKPYVYPVQQAYNNYAYKVPNYNTGINWGMVPGYMPVASGGRIGENNALANALRMLMVGNKS